MKTLQTQLNKETLQEKDSKSTIRVINAQFQKFIHSEMLKSSNYDSNAQEVRKNFKQYTRMEAQSFKDLIIQHMDSIEQCIVERARHEQEIQNRLKRLNERKLQIQECKIQEVKASNASSRDTDNSGIVSDKGNDQSLENQSNTSEDESSRSRNKCNDKSTSGDDTDIRPSYDTNAMVKVPYTAEYNVFVVETQHSEQPESVNDTHVIEKDDSNVILDSSNMCDNDNQADQNAKAYDDEQCKSTLEETNRTLRESNSTWDCCLIGLQNIEIELEKYKTYLNRRTEYDILECKLKDTLGLLAQKENDLKEGLKLKAYEISVVKEKHDALVKHSLLTKSSYGGLLKEKNKVLKDLKLKEGNDIDKLITMEQQLKFLNEIVYKQNQSIQAMHVLAPKGSTYNGIPTFANPMYLKKAQSKKPCLYEIPYDTSDLANRFAPDREEALTLEQESKSKLNKDLVKPYDYTKRNSLYEVFKPPTQKELDQLWLQGHTLSYNTSSLDDKKYSSLSLDDQSLDHLETMFYDLMIKG
ncbi:hypothetical protein Tco_0983950 [Tanacetum coccineum]